MSWAYWTRAHRRLPDNVGDTLSDVSETFEGDCPHAVGDIVTHAGEAWTIEEILTDETPAIVVIERRVRAD